MAETEKEFAPVPGVPPTTIDRSATITRRIPTSLLFEPPDAMRHNMDDEQMQELIDSVREVGLLQDLCVIPMLNAVRVRIVGEGEPELLAHEARGGTYQVRAGHRRLLACRALHMDAIGCKVFCDPESSEKAIMAHENSFREEPSDFDLAVLYTEWLKEDGMTEATLRKRSGKSLEFIYGRAQIMNGWEFVATALHERKITYSVARALNREEDEAYARHFLNMAVDQGAKQRLVDAWVTEHKAHVAMTPEAGPGPVQTITAPNVKTPTIECCICGERQSYNLKIVYLCHADYDRVKQARAEIEAAERRAVGPE